jgi:hypothetical protein
MEGVGFGLGARLGKFGWWDVSAAWQYGEVGDVGR